MRLSFILFTFCCLLTGLTDVAAQGTDSLDLPVYDYSNPAEYEIGAINVKGAFFAEQNAIIGVTGLSVGDKIRVPGPDIPRAIKNLWRLRLFTDVRIEQEKTIGDVIFLTVRVQERPRFLRHSYTGVKQAKHEDLNEIVNGYIVRGGIVTEDAKVNAAEGIRNYYVEKGYLDAEVNVSEIVDSSRANSVRLLFDVDRNRKIKIQSINFDGNTAIVDKKLRKQMKETNQKSKLFKASKFQPKEYKTDKQAVINFYNTLGYRGRAHHQGTAIYREADGDLVIDIDINEGNQYYFRKHRLEGGTPSTTTKTLSRVLAIEKGDIYNQEELQERLSFSQTNSDVSSLYMDNGLPVFSTWDPHRGSYRG